jgi:SHS2 domain-containing protein
VKYRYLDQTSDLGVEIFGKDLPGLFSNACCAVFDNILDLSTVVAAESRRIELHSATREELFLDWLRELLFRFSTEYFVVKEVAKCEVRTVNCELSRPQSKACSQQEWQLTAEVMGEKFDPARHQVKIEIKTPTYHMFSITQDGQGYGATVIFDV